MDNCIANSSFAHTVGNVTSLFTEYIKHLFPNNYFRHTHISTRMAYREQKREENTKYEFIKKEKPILIVRPRIDIDSDDIFLTNTMLTTNLWGTDITNKAFNLQPLFVDKDHKCDISYMMARARMNFDFTILVDTEFEQINQYAFLHTLFTTNRVYWMQTALENYIPSDLLELVSAYTGVPIFDDNGRPREFLQYMMQKSNHYITYKESNSNGTKEFFVYYPLTLDFYVSDFSKDDPNKKSWATYSAAINFTIVAEFNYIQLYRFDSALKKDKDIAVDLSIKPENDKGINVIPYFTVGNLFDKTSLNNGFDLFYSQAFETDPSKYGKSDILELNDLFERTDAKKIIVWNNECGISNKVFMQFIIMENNKKLEEDVDYTIDWKTFQLTILKSDPDATYRLNIFVNNLYAAQMMENISEDITHEINNKLTGYEQEVGNASNRNNIKLDNDIGLR